MTEQKKPTPDKSDSGDFKESVIPDRDRGHRTLDETPRPGERKIYDVVDTAPPPPPKKEK